MKRSEQELLDGFPQEIAGDCNSDISKEEILREINSVQVNWRHPIEIQGIRVPAEPSQAQHTLWMLNTMNLPTNMRGQATLDIGCSDGFFSFESEKRGAKRVVGMDRWWGGGPGGVNIPNYDKENNALRESVTSQPFQIAHRLLKSKMEFYQGDVQRIDLVPEVANSKFDTIFFLGVFYHLENPLGALRNLRSICKGKMYLESTVHRIPDLKIMEFVGLSHDIQWKPSEACLEEMMKNAGFSKIQKLGEENDRSLFEAYV